MGSSVGYDKLNCTRKDSNLNGILSATSGRISEVAVESGKNDSRSTQSVTLNLTRAGLAMSHTYLGLPTPLYLHTTPQPPAVTAAQR